MKRYLLILLIFLQIACAKPIISNLTIYPEEPFLGDEVKIQFSCYEENQTIKKIQVNCLSPIEIPNSSFEIKKLDNYQFSLLLDYPYYGVYYFQILCESDSMTENSTIENFNFTVFNFTVYIDSIKPGKIYEGDEVKIFLKIKKNDFDVNTSSNINFQIFLNGKSVNFKLPPYFDASKGWTLTFQAPSSGEYKLKIVANVDEKKVEVEKNIIVHKLIDISFLSIDKTEILPNDTVTIKFFIKERDFKIDNSSLSTIVLFDSENISFDQNTFDTLEGTIVEIKMKAKETVGNHKISVKIFYKGKEYLKEIEVVFPIKVEGNLRFNDGSNLQGKIKFKRNNFERVIITNSSGYYSGTIPRGRYDIEIETANHPNYPSIKLTLNNTEIDSFLDPIKFDVLKNVNLEGLLIGGAYYVDVSLDSYANIQLSYDQKKLYRENEIKVYRCEYWNFDKGSCDEWLEEVEALVDKDKNMVILNSNIPSTFIISCRKKLELKAFSDKKDYHMGDVINVYGYVQDEDGNYIADANVSIRTIDVNKFTTTDKNGYFSSQFLAPDKEGKFKIDIIAQKSSYIEDKTSLEINVTKIKKILIFVEDTIKVYPGNITIPLRLVNVGQADVDSCVINVSGLPSDFKVLNNKEEIEIKKGEERYSPISIFTPNNITPSDYIIKITSNCDGFIAEKQLLLIVENEQKMPTTKIVLPQVNLKIMLTFFVCFLIILLAFILKKYKTKNQNDSILKQIKDEIKKDLN
ncbi:MAG: carboxypeptidase-like regulatory domain-containing protein [Candidatus Aenigmatarchaeota archaeon]